MRLFWKIFISALFSFLIVILMLSYITISNSISYAEDSIVSKNVMMCSFVAEEVRTGYAESKWPFATLNELASRKDFLFWWIVMDDGTIHLANNASFMGTYAYEYFPQLEGVAGSEYLYMNRAKNYGIAIKFIDIGKKRWSFWLGFSTSELSEMARSIILSELLTSIMAVALLGAVLYIMIKHFIRPVRLLLGGTEAVASGNLKYRLKVITNDELGELASAFNRMTGDLSKSRKQIEGYAKNLERKVAHRTKDLDEKVRQLTGTKTAMLNMMEDMDEANRELTKTRDELEKSLRKLKDMDIRKDEFISIAAHELKTPLTSIHGFSQLLLNREVAGNMEKRENYLRIMDHETKRLAKLVNDILDLSRIDIGTMKYTIENVNVYEAAESTLNEMDAMAKGKGIRLKNDIEKGLPQIRTDGERLTEILLNLLSNAVKYTEKGVILLRIFMDGREMHFMVKDTGIGIARENHERIFERFYQVDSSYTRGVGGSGLGLSVCKEFVTALGGRIWFSSSLGKGSEFHFTLPIQGPPAYHGGGAEKPEPKSDSK